MHIATPEEVMRGEVTDVYFLRAREILRREGAHQRVVAEFALKTLPDNASWGILAGIEECAELLGQAQHVNVWSMPEGTLFRAHEPVMVIEGDYTEFGVFETSLLGMLCQASGIATKAARCRLAAGQRPVISFGARRMHPTIAPMVERSAYIGGCDGVAAVKSAELLGLEPSGTIPHALILLMGDPVAAAQAFHQTIDSDVQRVVLVDTFGDEKFEALQVAQALGGDLHAVRLDTPSSRRGDFSQILREVRWELDLHGFQHVQLFVSGGLDEQRISCLEEADAFGVGTSISNARTLDFAMDLVEIDGAPRAKRGKASGMKAVYRCSACLRSVVVPRDVEPTPTCECQADVQPLLEPLVEHGEMVRDLPQPQEIRASVIQQLNQLQQSHANA